MQLRIGAKTPKRKLPRTKQSPVSAGEKEAEHSVFDGPSSELIFFFSLEKKLKINREHTRLFSFCYCKAHVQLKSGIVGNKVTEKWSTGRGVGQQQENQALQSGSLKWHVPPNPCNGEHPLPPTHPPLTLSPMPPCPCLCSSSLRKYMYSLLSAGF